MKNLLIACTTLVAALPVDAQSPSTYSEAQRTYREINENAEPQREALGERLAVVDGRLKKLAAERRALVDRRAAIDTRENARLLEMQSKRSSEGVADKIREIREEAAADRAGIEDELASIERFEQSAKTAREAILAQIEALPEPPAELRPRSSEELVDRATRDGLSYFSRIAKALVPTRLKRLPREWLDENARLTR